MGGCRRCSRRPDDGLRPDRSQTGAGQVSRGRSTLHALDARAGRVIALSAAGFAVALARNLLGDARRARWGV